MKTTVHEERMLVVSDVHMGNPLHRPRQEFLNLVRFALENRYALCINGDGIDIAQLSIPRLTADLTPSLALMNTFPMEGLNIYYTVGNHDIALENFLHDLGWMKVVPFLNVYSGDQRIRVEHGHTYDEMFLKYPRTYFAFMMIGRVSIAISPGFYDFMHHVNLKFIRLAELVTSGFGLLKKKEVDHGNRITGERKCFGDGAEDVGLHGFDAIVFGHTHLNGEIAFEDGARYYNTGGWFNNPHAVLIDHGKIWFGRVAELSEKGDPFALPQEQFALELPADEPAFDLTLRRWAAAPAPASIAIA